MARAVVESRGERFFDVRFEGIDDLHRWLELHGAVPLPPYISHAPNAADADRYQTVQRGGRVVAVDTASRRALEPASAQGRFRAKPGAAIRLVRRRGRIRGRRRARVDARLIGTGVGSVYTWITTPRIEHLDDSVNNGGVFPASRRSPGCPMAGVANGRGSGLKIRRWRHREGSIPSAPRIDAFAEVPPQTVSEPSAQQFDKYPSLSTTFTVECLSLLHFPNDQRVMTCGTQLAAYSELPPRQSGKSVAPVNNATHTGDCHA